MGMGNGPGLSQAAGPCPVFWGAPCLPRSCREAAIMYQVRAVLGALWGRGEGLGSGSLVG